MYEFYVSVFGKKMQCSENFLSLLICSPCTCRLLPNPSPSPKPNLAKLQNLSQPFLLGKWNWPSGSKKKKGNSRRESYKKRNNDRWKRSREERKKNEGKKKG